MPTRPDPIPLSDLRPGDTVHLPDESAMTVLDVVDHGDGLRSLFLSQAPASPHPLAPLPPGWWTAPMHRDRTVVSRTSPTPD